MSPRELSARAEAAYALCTVDANRALGAALEMLAEAGSARDRTVIAHARLAAGAARAALSDLPGARADLEGVLTVLAPLGDDRGVARVRLWQALIARREANYELSAEHGSEALAGFWAAGDLAGQADALRMIGIVQLVVGDFVSALDRFAEACEIYLELGDEHGTALCANDAGTALFELGDFDAAAAQQEDALAQFRRTGAITAELQTCSNLGVIASALGDDELAVARLDECVARARNAGEPLPESRARYNLGCVWRSSGDHQLALRHFVEAEALARHLGERRTEIGATTAIARMLVRLGRPGLAVQQLGEALEAAAACGIQRIVGEAHEALAEAYEAIGGYDAAVRHLRELQRVRESVQRAGAVLRMKHQESVAQLRREREQADLRVLKAQLQPHFLFNALNSLASLIEQRPDDAVRMTSHLGDLLRLALTQSTGESASLEQEIEFVQAYLRLEAVRFRGSFRWSLRVDPELAGVRVPHLLLQPIVENAIRHGLAGAANGSGLTVDVRRLGDDRVRFVVEDDGLGLRPPPPGPRSGFGLRNTRLRLHNLYGARGRLLIEPRDGGGTRVEIELPLER